MFVVPHGIVKDGDATSGDLFASANVTGDRVEEHGTDQHVLIELTAVVYFLLAVVRPRDALGSVHVFVEAVRDPRVFCPALSKELQVFELHFTARKCRHCFFKDSFELALGLKVLLVGLVVVLGLSVVIVVSIVKLGRHVIVLPFN